jgi:hypothetical protein
MEDRDYASDRTVLPLGIENVYFCKGHEAYH